MQETAERIRSIVREAAAQSRPLRIRGTGTKDFYGGAAVGDVLDVSGYRGIIDYDPGELVVTVRAGTPLRELEAVLDQSRQMLAFEPPRFGAGGTIGGCIACGFSGPRRASAGSARDFVLGLRIIDGKGEDLRFGGRVIKNVAGFDVSRLMVGALGTLGVLLDISLKVLPQPAAEITLRLAMDESSAIEHMNRWAGQPLPISATSFSAGILHVRLSGVEPAVRAAQKQIGGEALSEEAGRAWWTSVRDHTAAFFSEAAVLWRVSVPPTSPPVLPGIPQLIEWNGGLRWLAGQTDAQALRRRVEELGGHATLFRSPEKSVPVFHPLAPGLARIHRGLKQGFDPANVLNRGRFHDF